MHIKSASARSVLHAFNSSCELLEPRALLSGGFCPRPDGPDRGRRRRPAPTSTPTATWMSPPSTASRTPSASPSCATTTVSSSRRRASTSCSATNCPHISAADFDNDGDVDILALGFRLFRNTGGVFGAAEVLSVESIQGAYFVFDEDGDDLPDVFVQNSATLDVTRHRNIAGTSLDTGAVLAGPGDATLIAVYGYGRRRRSRPRVLRPECSPSSVCTGARREPIPPSPPSTPSSPPFPLSRI